MTETNDWDAYFRAAQKVPGGKHQQPAKKNFDELAREADYQRRRYTANVAVAMGAVDTGDNFDPDAWISDKEAARQAELLALDGRITALEGGGTVTTYTVSGTWTNPYPSDHKLIQVICVNGGDGGGKAALGYRDQPKGGQSGGYIQKSFFTDELDATVAMTIGAAGFGKSSGGGPGGVGGVTSFGSYLVGIKGIGAVYNDGARLPDKGVPPGNGGNAVFTPGTGDSDILIPSSDGQGGPFAAGGRAGFGTGGNVHGDNGSAAPANIPSGGGGGGGGSATSTDVGDGGTGGFPGGGGGAAAKIGIFYGNGGYGGAGCIYIVMED